MRSLKNIHKLQDTRCNSAINASAGCSVPENSTNVCSSGSKMFSTEASKIKQIFLSESNNMGTLCGDQQAVQPIHSTNGLTNNRQTPKNKLKAMKNLSNIKEITNMIVNKDQKRQYNDLKMDNRTNREQQRIKTEKKKKIFKQTQQQLRDSLNNQKSRKVTKNTNRSKIDQNLVFQKQNNTCKGLYQGKGYKRQIIQQAFLGIKKQNQFMQNLKKSLKNSKVSKNYELQEQQQNSIQYIDNETPGPGRYLKSQKVLIKQTQIGTFGNSQRFIRSRPITAKAQFIDNLFTQKSKNSLKNDEVAFGTNKKNLRSQVRKIQYCDWNRPHFYEVEEFIKNKCQKQDPFFQSNIDRFTSPELKYRGPDFYEKDLSNLNKSNNKPCYYFLSQVPKGFKNKREHLSQYQYLQKNNKKEGQKKVYYTNFRPKKSMISKETEKFIKQKQKKSEDQILNSIQNQTRKNSLGDKKRKPKLSHPNRSTKSSKVFEVQKVDKEGKEEQIQQIKLLQTLLKKKDYRQQPKNNWIKTSYNVNFQSKTTLI